MEENVKEGTKSLGAENKEIVLKLKSELEKRNFSRATTKNYCFFIEKFLVSANKNSNQLNEEDAKNYIDNLKEKKSNNTLMLAAASLKFYLKMLGKDISLELPKKEKKQEEILTKEEIKKLFDSCETEKSRLILSLLYSSGLKTNEIINLKKGDIILNELSGEIKKDTGGKFFLISKDLSDKLKSYIEKHPENRYLFSKEKPLTERNIQKIIKNLRLKADIKKRITPLTFRNYFAKYLIEQEINTKFVKSILKEDNLQKFNGEVLLMEQLKQIKNPLDVLFENEKAN